MADNQHAISTSSDCTVKLFNVNDGAVLRDFTHHWVKLCPASSVTCLALLPDGLRFVSGGSWESAASIAYHGLAP